MARVQVGNTQSFRDAIAGLANEDMIIELTAGITFNGGEPMIRCPSSRHAVEILCGGHTICAEWVESTNRHSPLEFNGQRAVVIDQPVLDRYDADGAFLKFHGVGDVEIYSPMFRDIDLKYQAGDPQAPSATSRSELVCSQVLNGDADTLTVVSKPGLGVGTDAVRCSGNIWSHVDYLSCRQFKLWRGATFSDCGSIISPAAASLSCHIILRDCRIIGRPKILHMRQQWFSGPFLFVPPNQLVTVERCVFKGDQYGSLYRGYAVYGTLRENDYSGLTIHGPFHSMTGVSELSWAQHVGNGWDTDSKPPAMG